MAFFFLESDLNVPVKVSAHGYKDFTSFVSIASNVTHLVEANLCRFVSILFASLNSGYKKKMNPFFSVFSDYR